MTTYSFISTDAVRPAATDAVRFDLTIRQQPDRARVCTAKEKDRRPLDPPPIVQLQVRSDSASSQNYLQNPYLFMCANLVHATEDRALSTTTDGTLAGTIVSSLYRLKDIDNSEGGFFVFADVSLKVEGTYRMRFNLFEVMAPSATAAARTHKVVHMSSVISQPFTVYSVKAFPGMLQSTFLSRSFSDQGVRIRIRKEHRMQLKPPTSEEDSRMQEQGPLSSELGTAHYTTSSRTASPPNPYRDQYTSNSMMSPTRQQHQSLRHVSRSEHRLSQPYHPYASHGGTGFETGPASRFGTFSSHDASPRSETRFDPRQPAPERRSPDFPPRRRFSQPQDVVSSTTLGTPDGHFRFGNSSAAAAAAATAGAGSPYTDDGTRASVGVSSSSSSSSASFPASTTAFSVVSASSSLPNRLGQRNVPGPRDVSTSFPSLTSNYLRERDPLRSALWPPPPPPPPPAPIVRPSSQAPLQLQQTDPHPGAASLNLPSTLGGENILFNGRHPGPFPPPPAVSAPAPAISAPTLMGDFSAAGLTLPPLHRLTGISDGITLGGSDGGSGSGSGSGAGGNAGDGEGRYLFNPYASSLKFDARY